MNKNIFLTLILYFLYSITAFSQSKIIEDFVKKNSSKDGIAYVNLSAEMLKSIFGNNKQLHYSSLTVTKTNNNSLEPSDTYLDFQKQILYEKYEQYMERQNNGKTTSHYQKQSDNSYREIFIISRQNKDFSVIYFKGDFKINEVNALLLVIRTHLILLESGVGFAPTENNIINPDFSNFDLSCLNDISKQLSQTDWGDMEKLKEEMEYWQKYFEESFKNFKIE